MGQELFLSELKRLELIAERDMYKEKHNNNYFECMENLGAFKAFRFLIQEIESGKYSYNNEINDNNNPAEKISYLSAVDRVCLDCLYLDEEICNDCPVRKTVTNMR